MKKCQRVKLLI